MPISSIPSISRTRSISLSLCTLITKSTRKNNRSDDECYFRIEANNVIIVKEQRRTWLFSPLQNIWSPSWVQKANKWKAFAMTRFSFKSLGGRERERERGMQMPCLYRNSQLCALRHTFLSLSWTKRTGHTKYNFTYIYEIKRKKDAYQCRLKL